MEKVLYNTSIRECFAQYVDPETKGKLRDYTTNNLVSTPITLLLKSFLSGI